MAPLGGRAGLTALHGERSPGGLVWKMVPLAECGRGGHVGLTALHVERFWQTAPLAECGRVGHVLQTAPVVGRGCDVLAMVSLERRSWVELRGI